LLFRKARNKVSNITTHKGERRYPSEIRKPPGKKSINRYGRERKRKEKGEDKNTLKMNLRQRKLFLLFAILGSTRTVVDGRQIAARAMIPERRQESGDQVTEVRFTTSQRIQCFRVRMD